MTAAEFEFVATYLSALHYDDYDRLLQLADGLALPHGLCLLEKRLIDVALRHGVNEHMVDKWRGFVELQKHFDKLIGSSIYEVLPGVVETTFGLEGS